MAIIIRCLHYFCAAQYLHSSKSKSSLVKLHLDTTSGSNAITGHGNGFVAVNGMKIGSPLIVLPDKLINPWQLAPRSTSAPLSALSLCAADFADLLALKPELVVFGSGALFRFPDQQLMKSFAEARIGFEVMDTPAACRTYTVLMSEGRRIAAALLIGYADS